jgi:uncharacterized membrane protein YidH (DUF202 family)
MLMHYSLRPILLFANTDVSIIKICLDISTLVKSIMGRREYHFSRAFIGIFICIKNMLMF